MAYLQPQDGTYERRYDERLRLTPPKSGAASSYASYPRSAASAVRPASYASATRPAAYPRSNSSFSGNSANTGAQKAVPNWQRQSTLADDDLDSPAAFVDMAASFIDDSASLESTRSMQVASLAAQAQATVAEAQQRSIFYRLACEQQRNRKSTDFSLFLLRLVPLLLVYFAVWQIKNFSVFAASISDFAIGGIAPEVLACALICGEIAFPVLLGVGLATRFASVALTIQLVFSWVMIHSCQELADIGGLTSQSAVFLALLVFSLLFSGSGRMGLDFSLQTRSRERKAEQRADQLLDDF